MISRSVIRADIALPLEARLVGTDVARHIDDQIDRRQPGWCGNSDDNRSNDVGQQEQHGRQRRIRNCIVCNHTRMARAKTCPPVTVMTPIAFK